jgi:poly(3-hydroxybutyrate) depolymerase
MTVSAARALLVLLVALGAPAPEAGDPRGASEAKLASARARKLSDVEREVSLPSIERLLEDAADRAAHPTLPERDRAYVQRTLATAADYARRLAAGEDPYATARGPMVKAYRAGWDGTLQPYALYVPRDYDARKAWPLVVALHGAFSNARHNLRRVFGLENRPGESDDEAARNELPLPDLPAIVVSPEGRGAFMGYDGLGEEDVMRVLADVRRAYNVDPDRITLTGLSMGGGGTWNIGLRHPELFAAIAPVCAVADARRMVRPTDAAFYDLDMLDAMSPPAIAENAANMQVLIFHGADDPTVPVGDSRKMVERYRALGWLGKNVRYTEYPHTGHFAWVPAYKDAGLLRTLAAIKRDPTRPLAAKKQPADQPVAGLFGKSIPREHPHIYVYGTRGAPDAVAAARGLAQALADWGPGVAARFAVKADSEVTGEDRAKFNLVLVGAAPLNALAAAVPVPALGADKQPLGDRAFRALAADPKAPSRMTLVFGALTPAGLQKLRRFAGPNKDRPAPEPNRAFAWVP